MRRRSTIRNALLIVAAFLPVLTAGSTHDQLPEIGFIDFFGLGRIPEHQARRALRIREGDPVSVSLEEAERRLEALPNVQQARLHFVCCEAGKSILYVGVKERGAKTLRFRPAPHGTARLPASMIQAGEALDAAVMMAAKKGDVGEDDSQGHALFHNPEARALQEHYVRFAAQDLKLLRAVLRESSDARHRALAAEIIAYAANKRDVVPDLVYAVSDPDGDVRNNSIRALAIIAKFAGNTPDRRLKIPVQPFIEMLNSIEWTDRNKSLAALLELTEKRDRALLERLRQRALPSLIEMVLWKSPGHAYPPFFILGRLGNLSEEEIRKAWSIGDRQFVIGRVLNKVDSK